MIRIDDAYALPEKYHKFNTKQFQLLLDFKNLPSIVLKPILNLFFLKVSASSHSALASVSAQTPGLMRSKFKKNLWCTGAVYLQDSSRTDMAHSNPYAKISLNPDKKNFTKQTTVQKKTQDPSWEEVFKFELSFKEVLQKTLQITVKDFDKYSRHCVIGQIQLELGNVNLIRGGHMWKPLLPAVKVIIGTHKK